MSTQPGGKADTIVKVVLVFFISLLSFSVGTFVGKQVSDSDHRQATLETNATEEREIASVEENAEKVTPKDVENLTEEFVAQEKSSGQHESAEEKPEEMAAHSEEPTESHEAHAAPAAKEGYKAYARGAKKDVAAIAEKVAEGEAPSDGKLEERKPSSVLPSVASSAVGKFTVQVASYPEEKEAKVHAADLKTKGWNAFYLPAKINGREWYRVSVGLFNNDKTAQTFRAQFLKDSGAKAAIIQKIVQ